MNHSQPEMPTMFTEAPKPTAEQLAQADKLDRDAAESLRREQESFDRCDTDGFLSQWAHTMTASLNRAKSAILRNGGCAVFSVLCDSDGNVICDRTYTFPDYARPWVTVTKWRLPDELAAKVGRKWIPYGERSRVQKQLGLHEESRWFPAYAELTTGGRKSTGLSGCANAYVGTFRKQG